MKNIHILSTDKPSRLYLTTKEYIFEEEYSLSTDECQNKHICITSNEKIKEGDWCIDDENNVLEVIEIEHTSGLARCVNFTYILDSCKKIILTTDQDLIEEGIQAIDNEFLEWFVKNPSCNEVEIYKRSVLYGLKYNIIIPKNYESKL